MQLAEIMSSKSNFYFAFIGSSNTSNEAIKESTSKQICSEEKEDEEEQSYHCNHLSSMGTWWGRYCFLRTHLIRWENFTPLSVKNVITKPHKIHKDLNHSLTGVFEGEDKLFYRLQMLVDLVHVLTKHENVGPY